MRLISKGFYRAWACALVLVVCAGVTPRPCGAANSRPVVIEEFTFIWCTYCYGVGTALGRMLDQAPYQDLIVVAYHLDDPYSIPFDAERRDYYNVTGEPTVQFNGLNPMVGGSSVDEGEPGVDQVTGRLTDSITAERARVAGSLPFELRLTGSLGPENPSLDLFVSSPQGYPRPVNAIFLIVEEGIPVTQTPNNGELFINAVPRATLGTRPISLTAPGSSTRIQVALTGTVPHHSAALLRPVVFLQDDTTKEILGAAGALSNVNAAANWNLYP